MLAVRKFLLCWRGTFCVSVLCPLLFMLSLYTTEKSLVSSSWYPTFRYLYTYWWDSPWAFSSPEWTGQQSQPFRRWSSPLIIIADFCWTSYKNSMSFLYRGAQNWTKYTMWSHTTAESKERITFFNWLALLFITHHSRALALLTTRAYCWFMAHLFTRSSAELLSHSSASSLCVGLILPKDPAFAFVEFEEVPFCSSLQTVEILLKGNTDFWCVSHWFGFTSLGFVLLANLLGRPCIPSCNLLMKILNNTRCFIELWKTLLDTCLQVDSGSTLHNPFRLDIRPVLKLSHCCHLSVFSELAYADIMGNYPNPCVRPGWQCPLLSSHLSIHLSLCRRQSGWLSLISLWWIHSDYSLSSTGLKMVSRMSCSITYATEQPTVSWILLNLSEGWAEIYFLPVFRHLSWFHDLLKMIESGLAALSVSSLRTQRASHQVPSTCGCQVCLNDL